MVTEQIVNQTTQYAVDSIQGEITSSIFWMFVKLGFSFLAGLGASKRDLREIRLILGFIAGILGLLAIIDLFQLIMLKF